MKENTVTLKPMVITLAILLVPSRGQNYTSGNYILLPTFCGLQKYTNRTIWLNRLTLFPNNEGQFVDIEATLTINVM